MSRQPGDMKPRSPERQNGGSGGTGPDRSWRWVLMVLIAVVALAVLVSNVMSATSPPTVKYSQFLTELQAGQVSSAQVNANNGAIQFQDSNGNVYETQGPAPLQDPNQVAMLEKYLSGKELSFTTPGTNWFVSLLPDIVLGAAFIILIIWMARRAQGQMGGIMSIGRSRAKVYTTERPRTTFADVAGYDGVKMEIREVVDFLRSSNRFKEIGAKIPKGVLLVGPPGTGKTLLARAVAGEAGVPFMSVTGSDFMEMFVGVGASRVRDLFQTARKQAPAIIFIDEIDSIGRKRGAGLGGGHDEREQTLNQMLAEMDGFEATEGVVMMAATNRPDILDPALLRPGRFDRQIVVPLPDLEERLPILKVHCKDKRIGPDVDLTVVARGTPGMSGADLANLVNESALHAVRRGASCHRHGGLRRRPGPGAHGPAPRVDRAVRQGKGGHRVPRGRPRRPGLRPARRRPGPQGDDPADRHGARRHPAAPDRGAPHLLAGVHRGRGVRDDGRPLRRGADLRDASRPAVPTTSSGRPRWPARWSASSACASASGRWPGARAARCSLARI